MDIAKVRTLTDQEILGELTTAKRHLYDMRFQLATRQLTDFNQIAETRKTIARLLTVQTERGIPSRTTARAAATVAGGER